LQAPAVGIAQRTPIIVTQHGSPPVIDLTKSPDSIVTETHTSQTVPPAQDGPRRSPRVKQKPKRLIEDDNLGLTLFVLFFPFFYHNANC